MARLIDADATLQIIDNYAKAVEGEHKEVIKAIRDIVEVISPTVDAVEVVRCKDCKYYRWYGHTSLLVNGKNVKAGWCHRRIRYDEEYRMLPTDFCSYGERKESE